MSQQVINIGSAPDDGTGDPGRTSFDKCNQNFTELYDKGATEGLWNYNQTTTDTNSAPVSGRFKTNSGNFHDATQIAIHAITIEGIDRSSTLRTLLVGDLVQCQDSTNPGAWCRYSLQSLPVDNGGWFQLNVTLQADSGVASGDNQEIAFVFTANSGGGGGGGAYQPLDPTLTSLSDLVGAANTFPYFSTTDTFALDVVTPFARGSILSAVNAGDARGKIGAAPLASPTFTGDPQAPTPAPGDNDTSIATTAFVAAAIGAGGGGNVSNSGTPSVGQYAKWVTATTIQGVAPATVLSDIGAQPAGSYQPLDADLTSLAAASAINAIYYRSAANTWAAVTVGTGLSFASGTLAATGGGGVLTAKINVFTASGTFTPSANMKFCIIECVGGGGAGGGVTAAASYNLNGGGGGSGGFSRKYATATDIGASKSVTVGAGGTGVLAANGNVGGASSVGTLCIANGGGGGGAASSGVAPTAGAGAGIGSTAGDLIAAGAPGSPGFWFGIAASGVSLIVGNGNGASSVFGGGGISAVAGLASAVNGSNGTSYGAGGGGGGTNNSAASNTVGGNGSAGIVIITEFIG